MQEIHNVRYVRHQGYQKTLETVRKEYFWLGIKKDVIDYIARCMECHRVKVEHRHMVGFFQPLSIPECKWQVIRTDFITKLPRIARKHDSIMVVVNKLTKFFILFWLNQLIRKLT